MARGCILASTAYLGYWVSGQNRYILATGALFYFWRRGGSISFGNIHGSASWATTSELARQGWLEGSGPPLGRWQGGEEDFTRWEAMKRLLLWPWQPRACENVIRHFVTVWSGGMVCLPPSGISPMVTAENIFSILTFAAPGAGKTVGCAIPCLLTWQHAIIALDLKGDLWSVTSKVRRAHGFVVLALNPLHALDPNTGEAIPGAYWNPLDLIGRDDFDLIDFTRTLALALVPRNPDQKDEHWDRSAGALVWTLLIAVCLFETDHRNIPRVKKILYTPHMLTQALEFMTESNALGGIAADMGHRFLSLLKKGEKEAASVLSTAQRHLDFMNSPMVADSLNHSSFDVTQLAAKRMSLYIIIQPHYVEPYQSLVRLYLSTLLMVATRAGASEKYLVMYLLDEVAQLGRCEILKKALEIGRGFGIRMWWICQSLGQLETAYPNAEYTTLMACFGTIQVFGCNEPKTAKIISESIGKTTQIGPSTTDGWTVNPSKEGSYRGRSGSTSQSAHARDLITPDEVMRAEDCIILRQSKRPLRATKLEYWNDPELSPHLAPAELTRPSFAGYAICALFLFGVIYIAQPHMTFKRWARNVIHAVKHEPLEGPRHSFPAIQHGDYEAIARRAALSAMTITLTCPRCAIAGSVPGTLVGTEVVCEACDAIMTVPDPTEEIPK